MGKIEPSHLVGGEEGGAAGSVAHLPSSAPCPGVLLSTVGKEDFSKNLVQ